MGRLAADTWGTRGRADGAQRTWQSCMPLAALVVRIERPGALGSCQAAGLDPVALGDVLDRAATAVRWTRAKTQRKITRLVEAVADGTPPGTILAQGQIEDTTRSRDGAPADGRLAR